MNNWDKTKHRHTLAISAFPPKGYISIWNANETLTRNADKSLLGGEKENTLFLLPNM